MVHIHDDSNKTTRGMILYGPGYLCDINFSRPLPPSNADLLYRADKINGGVDGNRSRQATSNKWIRKHGVNKRSKKNKKNNGGGGTEAVDNFRMVDRYRPIYYAVSLGDHEMLVVEKPWLQVLRALPDPVFRKKYGKS